MENNILKSSPASDEVPEEKKYSEDDFLQLSGIQHFIFCRRQWALIHIEGLWQENKHTVLGDIFHKRAHNASLIEKRGEILTCRDLDIRSYRLGVSGACDVVEFHKVSKEGVPVHGYEGLYKVVPVEYKKGKPKQDDSDILQLVAQAICLEEMFCCGIPYGYLYYGEPKRRTKIVFSLEYREKVFSCFEEMHQYFKRTYTPKVKSSKKCKECSLYDLCVSKLNKNLSAKKYISQTLKDTN